MAFEESDKAIITEIARTVSKEHQTNCPISAIIGEKLDSIQNRLGKIEDNLSKTHQLLYVGNGTPSVTVRLDRIEQAHKNTRKWIVVIIAALSTLVGGSGLKLANSYLSGETTKIVEQVEK